VSGIDFYNDSKATSVDATLKALDAFSGGLWVILGGKDKGRTTRRCAGRWRPRRGRLCSSARRRKRSPASCRGRAAGGFEDAGCGRGARVREWPAGDTILLAPACASFDQFKSFEHRGEVFKQIVNQLPPKD